MFGNLLNIVKRFPFYRQLDSTDCGPTCLRIIAKYYGKNYSLKTIREKCSKGRSGVSILNISEAANSIGFKSIEIKTNFEQLREHIPLPCIAHWRQNHFVVIYKISRANIYIADPAFGLIRLKINEFVRKWYKSEENEGVCLLLEKTPEFLNNADDKSTFFASFKFLLSQVLIYKKTILQLFLGLLLGTIFQLIFPFLTQALVDLGINNQDIGIVYMVLIGQTMLTISRTTVDMIRSWLLLHMGMRINISLISDFLTKLMNLPIAFFDTRNIGDILQRINDNRRIESFLTSSVLSTLFSFINLIVFGIVLAIYSQKILTIFIIGSIIYTIWITLFLKIRRDIDYKQFSELSENQSNLIQLITGMQEIKLNNVEKQKRWLWERIQVKLFKIRVKSLTVGQYQQAGSLLINEFKNIIITYYTAKEVINGNMTLGMLMAVSYIIGQLNLPINQLIGFIRSAQDAKISLERLEEILNNDEEEEGAGINLIEILPKNRSLFLENVDFEYHGPQSDFALQQISMEIQGSKITAITGSSGSGKTTLLKLLLKFYTPSKGTIKLGDINLKDVSLNLWREKCGVVLQDGFIFSDSIAKNVSLADDLEKVNRKKLNSVLKMANLDDYVKSLPQSDNTMIGGQGHVLSKGQIQRILIARALYKDPEYFFLDEATNSIDTRNEKAILNSLERVFKEKTVIVVAHRLSTLKIADNIIVMENGKILEQGNHQELKKSKGAYYNLVKDQLEL